MLLRISNIQKIHCIRSILILLSLLVIPLSLVASTPPPPTGPYTEMKINTSDEPPAPALPLAFPTDPTSDIAWSAGYSGVADIQAAFNHARDVENGQLGLSIPHMSLPTQSTWNAKSNSEKALWLINRERQDRGVPQLHGTESNVISVAQNYANYLLAHNVFDHYADGHGPWWRLDQNAKIGACHDFLSVAENLFYMVTSGSSIALPVEQAVYWWMYKDKSQGWGHRHAILWNPYNDNSGPAGKEGFLGIGRANGPYMGWNFGEVIVMNVFDPCSSWDYDGGVTPLPPDLWLPFAKNKHK
jgi:uncharacterized protein YkwD